MKLEFDEQVIQKFQESGVLGESGPVIRDGLNGEPVAWGYLIREHLGEERWNELSKGATLQCVVPGQWAVITEVLARDEAIERYGPVTNEEFGPRGGWKSVTFGDTKFICNVKKMLGKSRR